MIAVADTSPLCYLILIGEVEVLPKLCGQVAIPEVVHSELLHPKAPAEVRAWASSLPSWTVVQEHSANNVEGLENLQAGERGAILLAESIHADIVLLDEKSARRAATARGLRITGTIGVLTEAAGRGLIHLPSAIHQLKATNFRYPPALLKALLDRSRV